MESLVEVVTSVFSPVASPNSWVYVVVYEGVYVRKKVKDLMPGDRVMLEKEVAAGLTIEDLEPYMELFLDYTLARDTIIVERKDGCFVPRFRNDLVVGISRILGNDVGGLEDRLLEGKEPLHEDERSDIVAYLVERGINISTATSWVDGEVVLPIRRTLACVADDDSRLKQFYGELSAKSGDLYRAYNYWKVARQKLMRTIGDIGKKMRGSPSIASESERESEPITKMPVVDGVIRILAEDRLLDRRIAFGKVTKKRRASQERATVDRPSYKGFAREPPSGRDFREINMKRLHYDQIVLVDALSEILYKEVRRTTGRAEYFGNHLLMYLVSRHSRYSDPVIKDSVASLATADGEELLFYNRLCELTDEVYREMHTGELDKRYKLRNGDVKKLFETCLTLKSALPASYHQHDVLMRRFLSRIRKEEIREMRKRKRIPKDLEIDRLERELKSVYDIDYSRALPTIEFKNVMFIDDYETFIAELEANYLAVRRSSFDQTGTSLYSRGEVNEIFDRYGLRRVKRFIRDVNFMIAEA